ncbi:MAG: sigma-54-dependent Fis family transcriptional regulator [bacterium]|nr:sigma-54-dependent Fis family transcriptional regulator [bacterium]
MTATLLIVDDDRAFRELVVDILRPEGYRLLQAGDAETALEIGARERIDVVLSDQRMPGMDGIELVRRLNAGSEPPAVVVMTAYGTIPQAVEAVRLGAADYLTKPLESPRALRRLVRGLLGRREEPDTTSEFLTRDPATLEILALADRAAATDSTVLVTGESGTGKEILARRIHQRSRRSDAPFVVVNSAALTESLAESELFGHEKGAFTGAVGRHRGRFEQANGGTLFLDEIGELSEAIQAKLLRALEGRVIERVGGSRPLEVDLRLIAATNRDLEREVAEGGFRSDLFYRLNVVSLHLPPLRQRPADLELLTARLAESLARRLAVEPKPISAEAMEVLSRHSWPGNVRELKNVLERSLIAASGEAITPADLPILGTSGAPQADPAADLSLGERERQAILEALERTGGHREQAARLLGISVRTLYNRLRQYGIH